MTCPRIQRAPIEDETLQQKHIVFVKHWKIWGEVTLQIKPISISTKPFFIEQKTMSDEIQRDVNLSLEVLKSEVRFPVCTQRSCFEPYEI